MKQLITALLIFIGFTSTAQNITYGGAKNQIVLNRGGGADDSLTAIPIYNDTTTANIYGTAFRKMGRIIYTNSPSAFWFNDGSKWMRLATDSDVDDNLGFSYVGFADSSRPIIPHGDIGSDDELIREPSAVFPCHEGHDDTLYVAYAGSPSPYVDTNVCIFLARSVKGAAWEKLGKMFDGDTAEDATHIFFQNKHWFYAEDKSTLPSPGIHAWSVSDLNTFSDFTDHGIVLGINDATPWQDGDVCSPTAYVVADTIYLLYEGRGTCCGNLGDIGLAKSTDGISFTTFSEMPIITGTLNRSINITGSMLSWATHVVPDQIFELNNKYYLSIHGWQGNFYSYGIISSTDLIRWQDEVLTWGSAPYQLDYVGDVMPYFEKGKLMVTFTAGSSLFKGSFKQNPFSRATFSKKSIGQGFNTIKNRFHDEIIIGKPTSDVTWYLDYQPDVYDSVGSGKGVRKIIKNDSTFNITLLPVNGVKINGSTSAIIIRPNHLLELVSSSVNEYAVIYNSANYHRQGGDARGRADSIGTTDNYDIKFITNNSLVGGFASATNFGNFYIGSAASNFTKLYINQINATSVNAYGVYLQAQIPSNVTNTTHGFRSQLGTQAASFTLNNLTHFRATQGTIGAGSSIANQYGYFIDDMTSTSAHGFYSALTAGTFKWGIYGFGTAKAYWKGDFGFNILSPTSKVDIEGETGYSQLRLRSSYTPTGTGDTNGNTGDISWDANYIYLKTSSGWKRTGLSTF